MMILLLSVSMKLIATAQASPVTFFDDLDNFKNKNLNLQAEKQNLDASSDFLLSKKLFWTPKLDISANQTETTINNVKVSNVKSLNGDLTLNLFHGGSDWNSFKDAEAQKKAQELQVLNEDLRVEIKASDLIFKALYLTESQRIQEQIFKLKEESYKIVTDRYNQGKLPLQEVTKSEVDLIQQKNKLRSARLDLIENKSEITSLFITEVKTNEWPFTELTTSQISTNAKIPLIEQKYWTSKSREEIWRASKGAHFPSLDLEIQHQESPIKERTDKQWVGMITLSFPIWNRYETSAQVSSSYAQYIAALHDYQDTEQTLNQKNLYLKEKIDTARMNLTESKKNLEISRKLYQDMLNSFRLGRISTNDLFLEQNRLLESENDLALSQLNYHQTLVETCALMGVKSANCLK